MVPLPFSASISEGEIKGNFVVVEKPMNDWFKTMGFPKESSTFLFPEEAFYLNEKGLLRINKIDDRNSLEIMAILIKADPSFNVQRLRVYLMLKHKGKIVRRSEDGYDVWSTEKDYINECNTTKIMYSQSITVDLLDKCCKEKMVLCCIEGCDIELLSINKAM